MDCGGGGGYQRRIGALGRKFQGNRGRLGLHGSDHCRNAHDLHHAGHIVGKHMQCHFRGDVFQLSHLEVGGTHPRFDRAK